MFTNGTNGIIRISRVLPKYHFKIIDFNKMTLYMKYVAELNKHMPEVQVDLFKFKAILEAWISEIFDFMTSFRRRKAW